jgi:hypothetical protein
MRVKNMYANLEVCLGRVRVIHGTDGNFRTRDSRVSCKLLLLGACLLGRCDLFICHQRFAQVVVYRVLV